MKATLVREKALPYQPMSSRLPKASVIFGIAVVMMVESRAERKMLGTSAVVMRASFVPLGYSL